METPAAHRMVVIHAHPDDEASKTAGTVAGYSDTGVKCVLVTATGGEEGEVLNPALDRPYVIGRLTELRRRELEASAEILGYDDVILLGYRDSGMADSPANSHSDAFINAVEDEVVGRLVGIIRDVRPQVMLGYDDHRWYPHPDHLMVHRVALAAFASAGDPDLYPEAGPPWETARLYAPKFSRASMARLHEALIAMGSESPLDRFLEGWDPSEPEPIHARVPITADSLRRARAALRAHATQIDPDGFWFKVPEELVLQLNPYEEYELLAWRVKQPEEVVHDLFAGLDGRTI